MLIKIIKSITKEHSKMATDPQLQTAIEYWHFLSPKIYSLLRIIIKRKLFYFFQYMWSIKYSLLIGLVFLVSMIYTGLYMYNKYQPSIVYHHDTNQNQIPQSNDSLVIINNIINTNAIKYFDFIASSEADKRGYKTVCDDTNSSALGRYQMIKSTRNSISTRHLGVTISDHVFLNTPWLQDIFMYLLIKDAQDELKYDINKYAGTTVNGYYITECGLISMSHATGSGFIKRWLDSNGKLPMPKGAPGAYKRLTQQKYKFVFEENTKNKK